LTFEHRMARSVWRFSDSKDVSTGTGQNGGAGQGTNYELYFLLYTSQIPDPVKRQAFVLSLLQTLGLNPSAVAIGGFLSSGASVVRRQELSFALSGLRDTITVLASRSESRRLGEAQGVADDLSQSGVVRQSGFTVSYSHRLTPNSSANLSASQQKNSGDLNTQSSTLRSILANWTATLGARTTLSLGTRYSSFKATQNPYNEKALYANLIRQF
jgi:uncharacterized protein (PEP-CTERM system associated)